MNAEWMLLYDAMCQAITECQQQPVDLKRKIEACFSIAQQYWGQVQQKTEEHVFASKAEEIEFYKVVKPLFKSEIEYYNLIYQADLFKPLTKPGEMKEYWIREQQKLHWFIQDNTAFYNYYKNGQTDQDELYFLSAGQSVYYDDMISMLQALERYQTYIDQQFSNR